MLEDLDSVDWQRLEHWRGLAADMPALIRDLTSPHDAVQLQAYRELDDRIQHQQDLCEVTSYVVPFLLELLGEESAANKFLVLDLLEICAGGSHSRGDSTSKEWVEKSYRAVLDGKPIIEKYLEHPDVKVRGLAQRVIWALMHNSPI